MGCRNSNHHSVRNIFSAHCHCQRARKLDRMSLSRDIGHPAHSMGKHGFEGMKNISIFEKVVSLSNVKVYNHHVHPTENLLFSALPTTEKASESALNASSASGNWKRSSTWCECRKIHVNIRRTIPCTCQGEVSGPVVCRIFLLRLHLPLAKRPRPERTAGQKYKRSHAPDNIYIDLLEFV